MLTGLVTAGLGTVFCNTLLKGEVTARQGRRCKQLLDDLAEKENIL
jgi:hypothetical protein